MSEHTQKQPNGDSFDELLKSALFQNLEEILPNAEEQETEPEFSEAFQSRIKALISETGNAERKAMEPAAGEEAKKVEETGSEERISETEHRETSKAGAELEGRTQKAEEAMSRMAGKIIPSPALSRHRKALVNAASILLVFGLGVFFLKGGIGLPGGAAGSAASGDAQMEMAAAAPEAETAPAAEGPENRMGNTLTKREVGSSAALAETEAETEPKTAPIPGPLAETNASPVPAALSDADSLEPQALSGAESAAPAAGNPSEDSAASAAENGAEGIASVMGDAGQNITSREAAVREGRDGASTSSGEAGTDTGRSQRTSSETAQPTEAAQQAETAQTRQMAQLPNPIAEVDSAAAFGEQLGFSMDVYSAARGEESTRYSIISGELAQIDYESEVLQTEATYRGMKREVLLSEISGAEEMDERSLADQAYQTLSGVYEVFDETKTENWAGLDPKTGQEVTISVRFVKAGSDNAPLGTDGALATWEQDGVMHSLWVRDAALHPDAVGKEARNLAGLEGQ